jgi:hypothetical protein
MNVQLAIEAAAIIMRSYRKLVELAQAEGMDPMTFAREVVRETNRIGAWLDATNAAEDAVFTCTDES